MSQDTYQRNSIYIDGQWVASSGTEVIEVENPATEQIIGRVPSGTAADVDRAVAAARAAFDGWAATSPEERGKFLSRLDQPSSRLRHFRCPRGDCTTRRMFRTGRIQEIKLKAQRGGYDTPGESFCSRWPNVL